MSEQQQQGSGERGYGRVLTVVIRTAGVMMTVVIRTAGMMTVAIRTAGVIMTVIRTAHGAHGTPAVNFLSKTTRYFGPTS